jgi:hypothetical protein
MSSGSIGLSDEPSDELARAIQLLKEAQSIVDSLSRPELGARLQDVIDLLESIDSSDE